MTYLKKFLSFLKHERYQATAVLASIIILASGLNCQSQVSSMVDPTHMINRDDLDAEVTAMFAKAEAKYKSLDRQDAFKRLVVDQFALWTTTGAFNPNGLVSMVATILGVGAIADNVGKRRDLKSLSPAQPPQT